MYLKIGELAKQTDTSTRTIRHYSAIGLLTSLEKVNSSKARKIFHSTEVEKLKTIKLLRFLGFNLNEIGKILNIELNDALDFKIDPTTKSRKDLILRFEEINSNIKQIKNYIKK